MFHLNVSGVLGEVDLAAQHVLLEIGAITYMVRIFKQAAVFTVFYLFFHTNGACTHLKLLKLTPKFGMLTVPSRCPCSGLCACR